MILSPSERDAVIREVARLLIEELRKTTDLEDLITLPLDAASAIIGLGPKQASRVLKTRPMGTRKLGVSLKEIRRYQQDPTPTKA
jgi:hypothetical protein